MRPLTAILIFFCLLTSHLVFAADFKITAPKNWQVEEKFSEQSDFSSTIYRNSKSKRNERVILESFVSKFTTPDFQENLVLHKAEIEKGRAQFFRESGLTDFTLLEIRKESQHGGSFGYVEILHARFRDLDGHDVQMIERQYFAASRMFVVTYLVDDVALNDLAHVAAVVGSFIPVAPARTRAPASEIMNAKDAGASAALTESVDGAATTPELRELNMKDPENQKRCERVPFEKRRTAFDPSFGGVLKNNFAGAKGCMTGVFDSALGLVKGIYESVKFAPHYALSLLTGTPYADQVNATVGAVASEIKKSPSAFAARLMAGAFNAGVQYVGEFFQCMNTESQMHALCIALTSLNPKLLVTLVTKAPLAVVEAAELASAMQKATGAELKLLHAAERAEQKVVGSSKAISRETFAQHVGLDSGEVDAAHGENPGSVAAGTSGTRLSEQEETIDGVAGHRRIIPGTDSSDLANRIVEAVEGKYGGRVVQGPRSEGVAASAMMDSDGRHLIVTVDKDHVPILTHETAHVNTNARASNGQDIGTARSLALTSNSPEVAVGPANYRNFSRNDEVFARVAEEGVALRLAEGALVKTNNIVEAERSLLSLKAQRATTGDFVKIHSQFYDKASAELRSPNPPEIKAVERKLISEVKAADGRVIERKLAIRVLLNGKQIDETETVVVRLVKDAEAASPAWLMRLYDVDKNGVEKLYETSKQTSDSLGRAPYSTVSINMRAPEQALARTKSSSTLSAASVSEADHSFGLLLQVPEKHNFDEFARKMDHQHFAEMVDLAKKDNARLAATESNQATRTVSRIQQLESEIERIKAVEVKNTVQNLADNKVMRIENSPRSRRAEIEGLISDLMAAARDGKVALRNAKIHQVKSVMRADVQEKSQAVSNLAVLAKFADHPALGLRIENGRLNASLGISEKSPERRALINAMTKDGKGDVAKKMTADVRSNIELSVPWSDPEADPQLLRAKFRQTVVRSQIYLRDLQRDGLQGLAQIEQLDLRLNPPAP